MVHNRVNQGEYIAFENTQVAKGSSGFRIGIEKSMTFRSNCGIPLAER